MKTFLLLVALAVWPFSVHAQTSNNLTVVEHQYVCMVNDQLFPNAQIPVQYDGKTYYGCCPMCKERLAKDASMRMARDPVSGALIDKANAVIGARPNGKVLYFENIENLKRYK